MPSIFWNQAAVKFLTGRVDQYDMLAVGGPVKPDLADLARGPLTGRRLPSRHHADDALDPSRLKRAEQFRQIGIPSDAQSADHGAVRLFGIDDLH